MDASALRSEIVESQKFKVDLLKWKLLLAAGLGAAALGIEKDRGMPILLALIPLVCAYVDVICYHADMRILVVARFCRTELPDDELARKYEVFCLKQREVFKLENFALYWATITLSALAVLVAIWLPRFVLEPANANALGGWQFARVPVAAAGAFGLMASALVRSYFMDSASSLDGTAVLPRPWLPSGVLVGVAGLASMVIGVVLVRLPWARAAQAGHLPPSLDPGAIGTGVVVLVAGILCSGIAAQRYLARSGTTGAGESDAAHHGGS